MVLWYNLSNGKGTMDVQEVVWMGGGNELD